MKPILPALLLLTNLAGALPATAADLEPEFRHSPTPVVNYESGQVREFRVTLLDEHGQPAIGVPVELYGMRRGGRWPSLGVPDSNTPVPWWSFTTDDKGTIVARFAVSEKPWDHSVPREGRFYFVVNLPDGRRAVSPPTFHGVTRKKAHEEAENEWDAHAGDEQVFTDEEAGITMRLSKGHTVTGLVVDPHGKPLPGRTFTATHDLHIDSHTGMGGDIFTVSSTSDAAGKFKLEHVYPAACSLTMEGEGHWNRTQVTLRSPEGDSARWVAKSIALPELDTATEVHLKVEVAPQAPKYRYHGTVTDNAGKPLSGIHVIAGVSGNPTPETWIDSHHFDNTVTDASGRWELEVTSPWVRFLDVRKTEFGESLGGGDYENDGIGLAAPGEYHLKVRPADRPSKRQ